LEKNTPWSLGVKTMIQHDLQPVYISGLLQCDFSIVGLLFAYSWKWESLDFRKTNLIPKGQSNPFWMSDFYLPSKSPSSMSLFTMKHFLEVYNEVFHPMVGFGTSRTYSLLKL
jgi:hypothetical protein